MNDPSNSSQSGPDPRVIAARDQAMAAYHTQFGAVLDFVRDRVNGVLKAAEAEFTDGDPTEFNATVLAPVVHTIAQAYVEALPVALLTQAVSMRLERDMTRLLEARA